MYIPDNQLVTPPRKYRAKLGSEFAESLNFQNQGAYLPTSQNFSEEILWINRKERGGTQKIPPLAASPAQAGATQARAEIRFRLLPKIPP